MTEKIKKDGELVTAERADVEVVNSGNGGKSGFGKTKVEVADRAIDVENAIPIEEVEYRRIKLQEFEVFASEMPVLPVGIFLPLEDGGYEKITNYTFKKDLITDGRAEYDLLELPEARAGRDLKKHIQKIIAFLVNSLEKIGDYTVKEFAKKVGNSAEYALGNLYLADVMTMMLGCRIHLHGTLKIAVTGECPCERNTRVADSDEASMHDLGDLVIKYFQPPINNSCAGKLLFEVKLPISINDGKSDITKLYLSPLKLYQLSLYFDANKQTMVFKQAAEMIAAMPESEIYGSRKGKIFDENLWRTMPSKNKRAIEQAMGKLQPGPVTRIRVKCPNCLEQQEYDWNLPWINYTQYFLYQSIDPVITDD